MLGARCYARRRLITNRIWKPGLHISSVLKLVASPVYKAHSRSLPRLLIRRHQLKYRHYCNILTLHNRSSSTRPCRLHRNVPSSSQGRCPINCLAHCQYTMEAHYQNHPLTQTRCSEGGAGNSLALEFAAQGCRVFATARSLRSLGNLSSAGIEVLTLDVTSQESIDSLKADIASLTNGKLDVLYNNAGVCKSCTLRCAVLVKDD